ncbi:MAG TPA: septal ring lytic transglycosylase RlpA family protein [Acetobacteraceae bacterium]|jgi:rare lipoprotein A
MRAMLPWWLLLLALAGCAAPKVQTAAPRPACVQDGVASWYAPHPGQTRMADGGRLDSAALTAAHRYLPFGTMVRVTNLDTGRSAVVRITDRGPAVRSRIIDVSPAAAKLLEMKHEGTAHVRLEIDGAGDAGCLLREAANS